MHDESFQLFSDVFLTGNDGGHIPHGELELGESIVGNASY